MHFASLHRSFRLKLKFIEITQPEQVIELNGYRITAFKVNHNVLCYGYTLEILRQGKFSAERAKEQDIPLKYWNPLQKGQTIEADGITYTPEMVLGPARKGIKLTYTTDTRPTEINSTKCCRIRSFYLRRYVWRRR